MKKKFWIIIVLIIISVILVIIASYMWFLWRMDRVDGGFARPNFPYSDYVQDELNKMYPQTINEDVATTRTPEETHKLFLDNLNAGKLDEAVECCFREGDWETVKDGLMSVKEKGLLSGMINDLSNDLIIGQGQKIDGSSVSTYYYSSERDGKKLGSTIEFIKNSNGIWLIKSL